MLATKSREMGRKKATDSAPQQGEPETPKRITTTKVDADVLRLAKTVASFRGMELFEYVNAVLGEAATRDFEKIKRGE